MDSYNLQACLLYWRNPEKMHAFLYSIVKYVRTMVLPRNQCYSYTGRRWSGATTTKLLFSVKKLRTQKAKVCKYTGLIVKCILFLPKIFNFYPNAIQHSKYPRYNTARNNPHFLKISLSKLQL